MTGIALEDLTLADIDFNEYQSMIRGMHQKINDCNIFMTTVHTLKLFNNRFSRIFDEDGDELILYSMSGNLLIPTCVKVNRIEFPSQTSNCYKDLPVEFEINHKAVTGFLTQDKIIVKYSEQIKNCHEVSNTYYLSSANKVIRHVGNQAWLKLDQPVVQKLNSHRELGIKLDEIKPLNDNVNSTMIKEVNENLSQTLRKLTN